jgi:peptidoglycan hydrolase CwlO-like protein
VGALRKKSASLAAQSREAVVELYALESRLRQVQSDLARTDARAAELAKRQASARLRYRAAQQTMAVAQLRLGRQLRILYEQDEPDPIAIVLGATSLEEAIEGLESLSRTARATRSVIAQARAARTLAQRVRQELAVQVDRTRAARAQLAELAAGLERAQDERSAYIARLRHEQEMTASQIDYLERRAREAQVRSREVTQRAAAAPAAVPAPAAATTAPPPAEATTEQAPDASEPPPAPVESLSGTEQPTTSPT